MLQYFPREFSVEVRCHTTYPNPIARPNSVSFSVFVVQVIFVYLWWCIVRYFVYICSLPRRYYWGRRSVGQPNVGCNESNMLVIHHYCGFFLYIIYFRMPLTLSLLPQGWRGLYSTTNCILSSNRTEWNIKLPVLCIQTKYFCPVVKIKITFRPIFSKNLF